MAQDSSAPETSQAPQEIDIDELEVDILIVAKNPGHLKQTCSFLSRRGWPTTAHGNLSKAIEEIAEKRPDIVMISFNHPSPAVMRLPDIISQTFNLICVGFVEGTDTASTSKLNNVKIRHKIFGTASGPNFHRGIRRILAEKFNVKLDDKHAEDKAHKESNVTIRGSKSEDGRETVGHSENNGDAHPRGPAIISGGAAAGSSHGENGASSAVSGGGPTSLQKSDSTSAWNQGSGQSGRPGDGPSMIMQQSGAGVTAGSSGTGSEGPTALNSAQQDGHKGKSFKDSMKSMDGMNPAGAEGENKKSDDIGSVIQMGTDWKEPGQQGSAVGGRKKLKSLTASEVPRDAAGNLLFGEKLDSGEPKVDPAGDKAGLVDMLKKSIFENGEEEKTPQSLLEKAVENALKQVCKSNPDIKPIALKTTAKVGVFPIDSTAVPGYVVLAVESGMAEDEKRFLKNCENALLAAFNELGVAGKLENGFWLDVPSTPFEPWAQNAGVFSFKLTHLGQEIGVSFFQTEKPIAKAKPSEHKEMHTVSLADVSTEEPVMFKAYLHLKANDKFYLYLRNGRRLQPEQKQRLEAGDVGEVFMKSIDLENFRMFLASAHLKETIRTTGESDEDAA